MPFPRFIMLKEKSQFDKGWVKPIIRIKTQSGLGLYAGACEYSQFIFDNIKKALHQKHTMS